MMEFLVDTFLPLAVTVILSIALAAWVIRLVLFFAHRVRDRKIPNPHEKKETMGLPKGAMRTFLALSFTSIATLAVLGGVDVIESVDKKWILGQLGVIIAFYFGSKAVEAYAESQVKARAIDKAYNADEATKILKDVDEPPPAAPSGPIPEESRGGPSN